MTFEARVGQRVEAVGDDADGAGRVAERQLGAGDGEVQTDAEDARRLEREGAGEAQAELVTRTRDGSAEAGSARAQKQFAPDLSTQRR